MKYLGTKNLETNRLILRKLTSKDYKKAYENWCSNENVAKYVTWDKHKNEEETKKLFEIWEKDYEDNQTFRWIVELKENNDLIGTIDVPSKKFIDSCSVEIGYCYSEKYWGKGYATEALNAVIDYLFKECDADLIYLDHMEKNPASGKVMQKCGLKYDGTLRSRILDKDGIRNDLLYYSITKEEYMKK